MLQTLGHWKSGVHKTFEKEIGRGRGGKRVDGGGGEGRQWSGTSRPENVHRGRRAGPTTPDGLASVQARWHLERTHCNMKSLPKKLQFFTDKEATEVVERSSTTWIR